MKAIWAGTVIAESDDTVVVEGNHYFPPDSLDMQFFAVSETKTVCPWKGEASYFHVRVADDENADAAWFYPEPYEKAANLEGRVAFWRGVVVEE